MEYETNTIQLEQDQTEPAVFTICRDGEVDVEYYRTRRRRELGRTMLMAPVRLTRALGRVIGRELQEAATCVELDLYDLHNGTNLREQHIAQREAARNQAMAEKHGLTVES